ncbi:hypothetical protein MCUN1_001439 [Malassezia cuniculi]|uniref:Alpha,alpha-trehalose-phosphate synthase (UDP-forming) n=1 Tax=Malassezia cuniculi TaxID=948313 RepID=A0AAF0EXU1_9BASI|nr:hypothetical protein MCUN1_001439 [Malassezia cuniculi]
MSRHDKPSRRVLIAAFSLPTTVEIRNAAEQAVPTPPPELSESQELLASALSTRLQIAINNPPPDTPGSAQSPGATRLTFNQRERVNMSELMAEATNIEPKFLPVLGGTSGLISPPSPSPFDIRDEDIHGGGESAPPDLQPLHTTNSLVDHGRDAQIAADPSRTVLSRRASGSGSSMGISCFRGPISQSGSVSKPTSPPPRANQAPLSIISDLAAKQGARTAAASPSKCLFHQRKMNTADVFPRKPALQEQRAPPAEKREEAPRVARPRAIRPRSLRRTTLGSVDLSENSPITFVPHPGANYGLINAVNSVSDDYLDGGKLYFGTLGPGIADSGMRKQIEKRARREKECVPVWVSDKDYMLSYNHYCKQILWPTFHATLPTNEGLEREHEAFQAYVEVNKLFADRIVEEYQEGDVIWIHDYHLLLVPRMVRERLPRAAVGLFLHIAFPSSELFRCLGTREIILKGMLGADFVGFQTHNFCRHFKQTVGRILQYEATPRGVHHEGAFTTVAPCPIGIDVGALNARRQEPEVYEWVSRLNERYAGMHIIVGRDKLDWIKGVRHKLRGFELFLDENPSWVGRVVLVQVALATVQDSAEMSEATAIVTRINNKYGSLTYQPAVFLHVQEITFGQYLALLSVADAFMATSLREGMNLTTHEYVICQESKKRPLVLSEFTGTYSTLRACIGVNPWDTRQVANAINRALQMDAGEMHERWTDMHRTVVSQSAQYWVTSVLSQLQRAHLAQHNMSNLFTPRLEAAQLVSEWRAARSRLVVIDLEQTLVLQDALQVHREGFEPPDDIVALLQRLVEDRKNYVYVLSGKSCQELDRIAAKVSRVGLVAENGCYVRHCNAPSWTSLVSGFSLAWQEHVMEIMQYYTERTPGSWIEVRRASITWRFSVDPANKTSALDHKWALRQAAEMRSLIFDSLGERFSLRILHGVNSFVIMPKNVSRATAVQHIVGLDSMGMLPGSAGAPAEPDTTQDAETAAAAATAAATAAAAPPLSSPPSPSPSLAPPTSGKNILDFVLAIGQDDALLRYINQLDMTYVPRTCSTAPTRTHSAPQAAYQLAPGVDVVRALDDIIDLRQSDIRWGGPVMVDI